MAFQVDKIGIFSGYQVAPATAKPVQTQGIGLAFAASQSLKEAAIPLPQKSPFGHMSPVVQNDTLANRLDLFA